MRLVALGYMRPLVTCDTVTNAAVTIIHKQQSVKSLIRDKDLSEAACVLGEPNPRSTAKGSESPLTTHLNRVLALQV